jgi:hypothetical protein
LLITSISNRFLSVMYNKEGSVTRKVFETYSVYLTHLTSLQESVSPWWWSSHTGVSYTLPPGWYKCLWLVLHDERGAINGLQNMRSWSEGCIYRYQREIQFTMISSFSHVNFGSMNFTMQILISPDMYLHDLNFTVLALDVSECFSVKQWFLNDYWLQMNLTEYCW